MKIISGGQTGVDRAALDAALKHGIDCGGWCPAGRLDEFGKIPDRYPVTELETGGFAERTRANARDSDGTLVIYSGTLAGGSAFTVACCEELHRPYLTIEVLKNSAEDAAKSAIDFLHKNKIHILNVAGPRQSEWPEGHDYAFRLLEIIVLRLSLAAQSR